MSTSPLEGIRVVELGGRGPGPFAGMVLADYGADVVFVERRDRAQPRAAYHRGKRSIHVDLKSIPGKELARELLAVSDVCIEGFRPGVTERWGLGPVEMLEVNPRLVYARATGWGQTGPLAGAAGHDINYVALSGVLAAIGQHDGPPTPPLNLVGDFAGGGLVLVAGVLAALLSRSTTGRGDVIDAAMLDGVLLLAAQTIRWWSLGEWDLARERNHVDGGSPYYGVYRTADGRYLAVSANEQERWVTLVEALGLPELGEHQHAQTRWTEMREVIQRRIGTRNAADWLQQLGPLDVCVSEVLDLAETAQHPHVLDRGLLAHTGRSLQPVPAPRFANLTTRQPTEPPDAGADTAQVIRDWLGRDDHTQTTA